MSVWQLPVGDCFGARGSKEEVRGVRNPILGTGKKREGAFHRHSSSRHSRSFMAKNVGQEFSLKISEQNSPYKACFTGRARPKGPKQVS